MKSSFPLGSHESPVIVKTYSEQRAAKIAQICEQYGFIFILGLEADENLTDLERAIRQKEAPDNIYDLCPCGSGDKYKFCCIHKPIDLDI